MENKPLGLAIKPSLNGYILNKAKAIVMTLGLASPEIHEATFNGHKIIMLKHKA